MKTKFILLTFIFSFTAIFNAKDAQPSIEQGQTWYLESRSNKLTPSSSKVLYFFSSRGLRPIRVLIEDQKGTHGDTQKA